MFSVPANLSRKKVTEFFITFEKKVSTKYKATTTEECYFITITTVVWVAIFTGLNQKQLIIDALKHFQY